jgi:hypothetical protein
MESIAAFIDKRIYNTPISPDEKQSTTNESLPDQSSPLIKF